MSKIEKLIMACEDMTELLTLDPKIDVRDVLVESDKFDMYDEKYVSINVDIGGKYRMFLIPWSQIKMIEVIST